MNTKHNWTQLLVCLALTAYWTPSSVGAPVTFTFEAKLTTPSGLLFPLPVGYPVTGSYTFDLSSPGSDFGPTSFTIYDNAITDFRVTLAGYGTGVANRGNIWLGNPVQTIGSFNFLSDQYVAHGDVVGITLPTSLGDRHLRSAQIRLQDLDQAGLSSESLLPTPPDLSYFLDHTGPNYDADHADVFLNFDTPFGDTTAMAFQLTSLTLVPESSTVLLALSAFALTFPRYRR